MAGLFKGPAPAQTPQPTPPPPMPDPLAPDVRAAQRKAMVEQGRDGRASTTLTTRAAGTIAGGYSGSRLGSNT